MTLKRVNDFSTENPEKLDRELSQLEDNVDAEFKLVRKELAPQPRPVSFVSSASRGIVAIQPGDQLSVDTFIANASVVLPPLSPANFGRKFVLIKRVSTNAIAVSCQDATVSCNGGAFPNITAVGVTVFYCDASGYYR